MLVFNVVRSLFPAFRGYSQVSHFSTTARYDSHRTPQAMIIDEVISLLFMSVRVIDHCPQIAILVSSGVFSWSRLGRLLGAEILRRVCENMLDYMA